MKGRRAPESAKVAAPKTINEMMEQLQLEIEKLGKEIADETAALHQKELQRANLLGQLQAYASINTNPAEIEHGSD